MSTDPQPPDEPQSAAQDPRIDSLHARSSLINYASGAIWRNDDLKHVSDRPLLVEVRGCVQEFIDRLTERIAELPA